MRSLLSHITDSNNLHGVLHSAWPAGALPVLFGSNFRRNRVNESEFKTAVRTLFQSKKYRRNICHLKRLPSVCFTERMTLNRATVLYPNNNTLLLRLSSLRTNRPFCCVPSSLLFVQVPLICSFPGRTETETPALIINIILILILFIIYIRDTSFGPENILLTVICCDV